MRLVSDNGAFPPRLPLMKLRILAALFSLAFAASGLAADSDDDSIEFFEKRIRPVLVQHCYECHSATAKKVQGGLLLDTRDGIR